MNRAEQEAAARRILAQDPPPVPAGLYADALRRGTRMLRRRTLARRALWLLLLAAAVAFTVWALTVRPWVQPPSQTTPPVTGW
ncbi:hypothetical protein [Streptomyces thermodiastaticus]|jgi:hypothetical protein|uniref:hypothetical protein n=1 Tax=Streptomyces thermodiastaticus TaxID=44061 RepID=UPI00167ADC30|nr:hypothetical protein [Streptomyces thermodiastaticus]MCE7550272.1 hypothetical protein [Streptomyces thermodiastaticus]GHF91255.1 hypothetical protein GCM10018787_45090 [Streptomyces thermodiastaticus]